MAMTILTPWGLREERTKVGGGVVAPNVRVIIAPTPPPPPSLKGRGRSVSNTPNRLRNATLPPKTPR